MTGDEFERASRALAVPADGYRLSEEVEAVAVGVIAAHPRFQHLANHRIGYAFLVGKKPEGKGGTHLLARAVKAPALWADLGGYDAVVWANAMSWAILSEQQRAALIAHELCHLGENEKGALEMWEHDVEEFTWVAKQFGGWHVELRNFAEQLQLDMGGEP